MSYLFSLGSFGRSFCDSGAGGAKPLPTSDNGPVDDLNSAGSGSKHDVQFRNSVYCN
jgi:hypothetical protein